MNAEIQARIVDGKARLGMSFVAGLGPEVVAATASKTMEQMVGPFTVEMAGTHARMVFATCAAKMAVFESNGAFVVMIEFETMPPEDSEMGLVFAGCVDPKKGN